MSMAADRSQKKPEETKGQLYLMGLDAKLVGR